MPIYPESIISHSIFTIIVIGLQKLFFHLEPDMTKQSNVVFPN